MLLIRSTNREPRGITNLSTDKELLKKLEESARKPLSEEELRKQRVSFIMGSVGKDSGITRAMIEDILRSQEGRK